MTEKLIKYSLSKEKVVTRQKKFKKYEHSGWDRHSLARCNHQALIRGKKVPIGY